MATGVFERTTTNKATRWVGTLELPRVNGKRKRLMFYGPDQKSVLARLNEARHKKEKGTLVVGPRSTVAEWLVYWLREIVEPSASPSYYRRGRDLTNQYLLPVIGHIQLSKLVPADVRAVLKAATAKGLAPQTTHHIHATLRVALQHAAEDELIERNVAKLVKPPRVEQHEVTPLSYEEALRFQQVVQSDRLAGLFLTALRTGLRQGELLGLRWTDIDFEAGTITVSQARQRVEGKGLVHVPTKSKTSRRTVTLSEAGIEILRDHRNRQNLERLATKRWRDNDLVFCGDHGKPLNGTGVTKRWRRIRDAANLPPITFHDLRHTAASFLFAETKGAQKVAAILGHADHGALVLKTYSRVIPGLRPNDVSAMDRVLGG